MIKALRQGQAVGTAARPGAARGPGAVGALLWPTGLHHDPGPPAWALRTGATVVLARCERLSWGRGLTCILKTCPHPALSTDGPRPSAPEPSHGTPHPPMPAAIPVGLCAYKQPRQAAPAAARSSSMNTSRLGLGLMHLLAKLPLPVLRGIGWGLAACCLSLAAARRKMRCAIWSCAFPRCPLPSAAPGPKKRSSCFAKPLSTAAGCGLAAKPWCAAACN